MSKWILILGGVGLALFWAGREHAIWRERTVAIGALQGRRALSAGKIHELRPDEAAAREIAKAAPAITSGQKVALSVVSDPDALDLALRMRRARLARNYGTLYRLGHFPPEKIDRFESEAAQHLRNILDIRAGAASVGASLGENSVGDLVGEENRRYQAAQRDVLGAEGYAWFEQVTRALPIRGLVDGVAGAVVLTDAPLTGEQSDRLLMAIANASGDYQAGRDASEATVDWQTVISQEQAFLTPDEREALNAEAAEARLVQRAERFARH